VPETAALGADSTARRPRLVVCVGKNRTALAPPPDGMVLLLRLEVALASVERKVAVVEAAIGAVLCSADELTA